MVESEVYAFFFIATVLNCMDGMDESEIKSLCMLGFCFSLCFFCFFVRTQFFDICKQLFWNNYLVKMEILTLVISWKESNLLYNLTFDFDIVTVWCNSFLFSSTSIFLPTARTFFNNSKNNHINKVITVIGWRFFQIFNLFKNIFKTFKEYCFC